MFLGHADTSKNSSKTRESERMREAQERYARVLRVHMQQRQISVSSENVNDLKTLVIGFGQAYIVLSPVLRTSWSARLSWICLSFFNLGQNYLIVSWYSNFVRYFLICLLHVLERPALTPAASTLHVTVARSSVRACGRAARGELRFQPRVLPRLRRPCGKKTQKKNPPKKKKRHLSTVYTNKIHTCKTTLTNWISGLVYSQN